MTRGTPSPAVVADKSTSAGAPGDAIDESLGIEALTCGGCTGLGAQGWVGLISGKAETSPKQAKDKP